LSASSHAVLPPSFAEVPTHCVHPRRGPTWPSFLLILSEDSNVFHFETVISQNHCTLRKYEWVRHSKTKFEG
jgi:hypothetical protein